MPKVCYVHKKFKPATLSIIEQANRIITLYQQQGYSLTLRQLYYQFVSRDVIPNQQSEYKRLGAIISDARRAGLVDWHAIEDRTRNLRSLSTWDGPEEIVQAVADQFRYDLWDDQPNYIEVWFEKDALMGVFERIANQMRVPFFSCRGYTSDSEVWGASQRLANRALLGKRPIILHFGDHDPSGIDMTRDIEDRLVLFSNGVLLRKKFEVRRLALTMDQIEQYDPPPNPAKETDARFKGYQEIYGDESWELDALEPTTLAALVRDEVNMLLDVSAWENAKKREATARATLRAVSENWSEVVGFLKDRGDIEVEPDDDNDEDWDTGEDEEDDG